MKILIVDDSKAVREFYATLFKNHEVELCSDAYEFLMALKCFTPDVAIMDVHMNSMNGLDAIRKADKKSMRTIIVSADDPRSLRRNAQQLTAEGFNIVEALTKPVDIKKLREIVGV